MLLDLRVTMHGTVRLKQSIQASGEETYLTSLLELIVDTAWPL